MLDRNRLVRLLGPSRFAEDIRVFDEIGSTNAYALAESLDPYAVVVSGIQTAGRGRSGRGWWSPADDNVYFTIVLDTVDPARLMPLNIAAGFAVVDALKPYAPLRLKWPNDVVCRGRKVAGILLETRAAGSRISRAVLGIGLNVNLCTFTPDIAHRATSLAVEAGRTFDREEVLASVLSSIDAALVRLDAGQLDIVSAWPRYSANLDKTITVHINDVPRTLIERGITPEGFLVAEDGEGERITVLTGDIGYDIHS